MTYQTPLPAGGVQMETFLPWTLVRRGLKKVITPLDAPQEFLDEARREQRQVREMVRTPPDAGARPRAPLAAPAGRRTIQFDRCSAHCYPVPVKAGAAAPMPALTESAGRHGFAAVGRYTQQSPGRL